MLWLGAGVVLASAIVLVPFAVLADPEPEPVVVVTLFFGAALLGVGKQGGDILAIRLIVVSTALLLGWDTVGQHGTLCRGVSGCQGLGAGLLFGSPVIAACLAIVAVPITLRWNRNRPSLRPELPWNRVPKPRTWWQWLFVAVGCVLLLGALQILLGIPAV
jgi:hypothetical protein